MNARTSARYAAAYFILAATVGLLGTDSPRALARAQPPPFVVRALWSADRPPGVPPDRWIPISGSLGIVIDHPGPPVRDSPGKSVPQSLEGYFAVYHAGRWWRLLTNVSALMPLARIEATARGAR